MDRIAVPGLLRRFDDHYRYRRQRRVGRASKGGQCSVWITLMVVFFLLYASFVGPKFWFRREMDYSLSGNIQKSITDTGQDSDSIDTAARGELQKSAMILVQNEGAANEHKDNANIIEHGSYIMQKFPSFGSQVEHVPDRVLEEQNDLNKSPLEESLRNMVNQASGLKVNISENTSGGGSLGHPKVKRHRNKYFPCNIGFLDSTDSIVEPRDFQNFTHFSLEYVVKEENLYGNEPKFGGHQSLEERENTFFARDQTLHCGFVKGPEESPSTGFDIDEKDKEYMNSCQIVVSSCIFGNFDFLRQPASKKITKRSRENVCFVMFVDELTMKRLYVEELAVDERGYIGLWKIVIVKNLPYTDLRKAGKVPKFLSHRLFPASRYSIWIDSKLRLHADPLLILEHFLWRKGAEYAISNHYDRHCVWEEVLQNKRLNKYNHRAIDEQFLFYQFDGLRKFNESNENNVLPSYVPEGSFIVRAHTPMSNLFSCLWFNEVNRFTSRDQLSFAYAYLKLRRMNPEKAFFLNMFKDCERRTMTKLFRHRAEIMP
ncbi:probable hexosyltransferase MUCI70 isoform X2 [Nymphaea colorata]|uniref:probable hexosyltransferase MUCI70 isoform X2 n=1 Tax=Nymphaea colorata TaxID=210225 RepID=UPI00129EEFAC|nr:probable hexosyltransferase MUCI70 isoform X2 [Nymphaea colorata]